MTWKQKYEGLLGDLRGLLLDLKLATAGVAPAKDPLGLGLYVAAQRLERLARTWAEDDGEKETEAVEQLELPLTPSSITEVQGL